MKVSSAAVFFAFLQITILFIDVYGQCPWKNNAFPKVPHSYMLNADNLILYEYIDSASGYYDIACERGYSLDPALGSRITCLSSGSWSTPLPCCNSTGMCLVSQLIDFIGSGSGIEIVPSSTFIYTNGSDESKALGGSNITFQCLPNSQNVGGSLTVVCKNDNNWTPFPNCISTSPPSTPVPSPVRCPVNDDTWTFPNGYISSVSRPVVYSDDTSPTNITIFCARGYQIDSLSQGTYTCINGVWSARPYCNKTARCSLSSLKALISNPSLMSGMTVKNQGLATDMSGTDNELLPNSFIEMACADQYVLTDGYLNITCNADGSWSRFPCCTSINAIQSTSMAAASP